MIKAIVLFAVCAMCNGCTIGKLHIDIKDMNDDNTSLHEDIPPKPTVQLQFQWDF